MGNDQAVAEFVSGSNQQGTATLEPEVVDKPSGPSFLRERSGLLLGLGLVLVAATVAVVEPREHVPQPRHEPQAGPPAVLGGLRRRRRRYDTDDGGDGKGQQLAQTQLLQRAVQATGDFAERQGFLVKVEGMLERANVPLRPAEMIFFYAVGVVVVALLLAGDHRPARS